MHVYVVAEKYSTGQNVITITRAITLEQTKIVCFKISELYKEGLSHINGDFLRFKNTVVEKLHFVPLDIFLKPPHKLQPRIAYFL